MKGKKVCLAMLLIITLLYVPSDQIKARLQQNNDSRMQLTNGNLEVNISAIFDTEFEEMLTKFMEQGHIPSFATSVIYKDKIVWTKGYGEQPDLDTVYCLDSLTMTFTATAILQLYDQGLFELDDNVNDYLPYEFKNPNHPTTPITFGHLLSHQSSLNESWVKPVWLSYSSYYPQPGEWFDFNEWNYYFLGELIEALTNQTFVQYIYEHITTPLNMTNTYYDIIPESGPRLFNYTMDQLTIGYEWDHASQNNVKIEQGDGYGGPGNQSYVSAYGLRSTAQDLAHFLIAHTNGGVYNGVRILNETTVDLMHTEVDESWGLGWFTPINPRTDRRADWWRPSLTAPAWDWAIEGAGGPTHMAYDGFSTVILYDKGIEIGVVYLANQHALSMGQSMLDMMDLIFQTAYRIVEPSAPRPQFRTSFPSISVLFALSLIAAIITQKRRQH